MMTCVYGDDAPTTSGVLLADRARQLTGTGMMLLAILALALSGCASSRPATPAAEPFLVFEPLSEKELAAIGNPALRKELLQMADRDQRARVGLSNPGDTNSVKAMTQIDRVNTARMHEIVDEIGWPTISAVGSDGAQAAWLLAQHADMDLAFQRRCLQLMQAALERGDVYKTNVAYLTDRVLVNEGKKQEFGTQFYTTNGEQEPRPIRYPDEVDARRASMGLSTLEEYKLLMKT